MRFTLAAHCLIMAALLTSPAEARSLRKLEPTGQWVVNYAEDTCRLAREFSDGKRSVTVFFEQFVPGDVFVLSFVGKPFNSHDLTGTERAAIRFGPNEPADEDNSVRTATVGGLPAVLLGVSQRLAPYSQKEREAAKLAAKEWPYQAPPIGNAREHAATWLQLSKVLPYDLEFETGPMDGPLDALRACSWDTIKSWGLSIEEQKGLTRHATPTIPAATWFNSNDYPAEMLRQGYEGLVNFRVIVGADGTPSNCHVQSSTRPQAFDEVVCRQILKNGRFNPALDVNRKPIKSYYRQTAIFQLVKGK